ncbi:hypothetical protein MTO96_048727 [Rhipicephalus appendiculatus]
MSDRGGLPPKSPEEHVLSFLWYAANKACIRDVAGRFEVGESTHHRMMYRVIDFLLHIGPRIVTFPDDLEKLANEFKQDLPDELKFVFVHFAALLAFLNAFSSSLGTPFLLFFFQLFSASRSLFTYSPHLVKNIASAAYG